MSTVADVDQALTRLLAAERAWRERIKSPVYDPKKQIELGEAVKAARDEFLYRLESVRLVFPK